MLDDIGVKLVCLLNAFIHLNTNHIIWICRATSKEKSINLMEFWFMCKILFDAINYCFLLIMVQNNDAIELHFRWWVVGNVYTQNNKHMQYFNILKKQWTMGFLCLPL